MSMRLFNQGAHTCYFGAEDEKFPASSVLPAWQPIADLTPEFLTKRFEGLLFS